MSTTNGLGSKSTADGGALSLADDIFGSSLCDVGASPVREASAPAGPGGGSAGRVGKKVRRPAEAVAVKHTVTAGQPVTLTLPYPPSANRYWRSRIVTPSPKAGGYTFLSLLKDIADGRGVNPQKARVTLANIVEPFVSTYISAEGKTFKEEVGWKLKQAGIRQPFAGRVQVDLQLWPHRPLDWAKRARLDPLYWADTVQRLDLDNCRKALNDALKEIAFGDDKCIWKDSGEVMEPDGREACLVVTITPLVKAVVQEVLL